MDELKNTPASSIAAEHHRHRAPLHATMAGQRGYKQQQDPAAPEKKMVPLIEEDLVQITTCATPPP
jgi:hypothetical protein